MNFIEAGARHVVDRSVLALGKEVGPEIERTLRRRLRDTIGEEILRRLPLTLRRDDDEFDGVHFIAHLKFYALTRRELETHDHATHAAGYAAGYKAGFTAAADEARKNLMRAVLKIVPKERT